MSYIQFYLDQLKNSFFFSALHVMLFAFIYLGVSELVYAAGVDAYDYTLVGARLAIGLPTVVLIIVALDVRKRWLNSK